MKDVILILILVILAGCSTFTTTQKDISYENGKEVRSITSKTKARTFWDSKSKLANFSSTQTDKTQSAKVGALNQESSATNAVEIAERAAFGFAQGLKK